jgi:hypothetical protein
MLESIHEVCIKWQKDLDNAILGEIKQKAIENGIETEYLLNEKAIISALEKQIPKKPFIPWDSISGTPYCPNCEEYVRGCVAYCDHCGQALDWGDTE